jgi:hypothetical protein
MAYPVTFTKAESLFGSFAYSEATSEHVLMLGDKIPVVIQRFSNFRVSPDEMFWTVESGHQILNITFQHDHIFIGTAFISVSVSNDQKPAVLDWLNKASGHGTITPF